MIVLRDYQENAIGALRSSLAAQRRVLLVSPTGSGKTVMFSYIASRAAQNNLRVGIFAHRAELIDQISRTLRQFKVSHAMITSGCKFVPNMQVYVCSAQTYARKPHRWPQFDLGIIDEAHHCTTGSTWGACMERSPDARWIGVTATPERLDGRGLAESFDSMVLGPDTRTLIEAGALADYRLFAPPSVDLSAVHTVAGDYNKGELADVVDTPTVTGDAVRHYTKYLAGAPSVAFCVSVAHAEHVAEQFRAAGYTSARVDGAMKQSERKRVIKAFSEGRLNVLTSADLISEGFDVPGIHGAILLRPTQSLALYLQQVGRALRTAPGKDRAIILDHAGNCGRHGLPDQPRDWSLEAAPRTKRKLKLEIPVRQCEACYTAFDSSRHECPECGWRPAPAERKVEQVDGELTEIDRSVAMIQRKREQGSAKSMDALIALGRQRGMKNPEGWARHVMAAREKKRMTA